MPAGRPSGFTQEIADIICERLADGEALRTICDEEGMPSKSMVCRWLGVNEGFRDQYARAREMQADSFVDDILPIADDGRNDWMARQGTDAEDEIWQQNPEAMRRSQIRIDSRKWLAGKLAPKKYGEKVISEVSGPNGGPIETKDASKDEKLALIAFVLRMGAEQAKAEATEKAKKATTAD